MHKSRNIAILGLTGHQIPFSLHNVPVKLAPKISWEPSYDWLGSKKEETKSF